MKIVPIMEKDKSIEKKVVLNYLEVCPPIQLMEGPHIIPQLYPKNHGNQKRKYVMTSSMRWNSLQWILFPCKTGYSNFI